MVAFYQLPMSALSVTLVILLLASLKITLAFLNVFGNLATVVKCCFPCQWMVFFSVSPFSFVLNVYLNNKIKLILSHMFSCSGALYIYLLYK